MSLKMWRAVVHPGMALLVCCGLAGCSGGSDVKVSAVTGKVTLGDEPLPDAIVNFLSDSGFGASAIAGEDGTFRMTSEHGSGLPPGEYKLSVTMPPDPADDPLAVKLADRVPGKKVKTQSKVPRKYWNPSTSGLTASVTAGNNDVPVKLAVK